MKLKQSILAAAMLMAAALPMQAQAARATGTLAVSATIVAPSATVNVAGPLAFGTVVQGQVGTGTTSFDVTVTSGVPYDISFGQGTYGASSFEAQDSAQGRLPSGLFARVKYKLYSDSTKATAYIPMIMGSQITGLTGSGVAQTYPLYGEMTLLSSSQGVVVGPGTYTDTITITVTY